MEYKMTKYEKFTIIVFIVTAIYVTVMIMGCNAYKGIARHEPVTVKDSSRLANRYSTTFPSKPQVIKKGQTVYVKDTVALAKLKKQIDSIKSLPPKVLKLQDSCGKESIDAYNEGNSLGYTQGYYDGRAECKDTYRIDTVPIPLPENIATIYQQKLQLDKQTDSIKSLTKENITLSAQKQAKSNENWFWRIVALTAILWAVFKPKIIKLFNNLKLR